MSYKLFQYSLIHRKPLKAHPRRPDEDKPKPPEVLKTNPSFITIDQIHSDPKVFIDLDLGVVMFILK